MPTIFLSHTSSDKPVVESIALALKSKYGAANVFYDEWSIAPGDGIIERMDAGLTAPDFFVFFVSARSLRSGMVKLEWQSALSQAAKGSVRFVPVRTDDATMPAILIQTKYIDLYSIGPIAAARELMELVEGGSEFVARHRKFSNLTYEVSGNPSEKLIVTVHASHHMESDSLIGFALKNGIDDVFCWIVDAPAVEQFPNTQVDDPEGGHICLARLAPWGRPAIKPGFPLRFSLTAKNGTSLELLAVTRPVSENNFEAIPLRTPNPER